MLKKCGYNTEMIGKWHVGMYRDSFLPQNRGFDHFLGLYGGAGDYWTHETCFKPKVPKKIPKMCGYDLHEAYRGQEGIPRFDLKGTYSSDAFTDEIENRLKSWNRNTPLFTYLSLQVVHGPISPKKRFVTSYTDIYRLFPWFKRTQMLGHVTSLGKKNHF